MNSFFEEHKPTLIITGANGWVGRNAYHALSSYNLVLVDNHKGSDPFNRFGLENADAHSLENPEDLIVVIDLANERDRFAQLLAQHKPACVIHLAGVLENQAIEAIQKNLAINRNVLETCAERNIKVIAVSSIMVMYGAAISHEKISAILQKQPIDLQEDEQLTVASPLNNTEHTLKIFNPSNWKKNLTYIKTKEALENLAKQLTQENPRFTAVLVRLGWSGVKNPYEQEDNTGYSETSIYLDQQDLQSFIVKLTTAILDNQINGYRCYISVSEHPQRWVNLKNAQEDFGWYPKTNVVEKYAPRPEQQDLLNISRDARI